MPDPKPQLSGVSIVLLGSFNPSIFHPAWFKAEGLVRPGEADTAKVEVIHKEIAVFEMGKFRLQVSKDQFIVSTADVPSFDPLLDLARGTFRLLKHSPITKLGINLDVHYQMESEDKWHELGHKLTPKDFWNSLLDSPGMKNLTMQGKRTDGKQGFIRVKAEPSIRIHPGIHIQVNDHYEVEDEEMGSSADRIITILEESYADSLKRSDEIAIEFMRLQ